MITCIVIKSSHQKSRTIIIANYLAKFKIQVLFLGYSLTKNWNLYLQEVIMCNSCIVKISRNYSNKLLVFLVMWTQSCHS